MSAARRLQLPAALAAAAAIHAGVLIALTWPEERGFAQSFGTGGVTVSLGPAGRAPGGIPSEPVTVEAEAEPPEPLEPVAETSRIAEAEPDPVERVQEIAMTAAEMSEPAPPQAAEQPTAQPALAEEPRPDMAETPVAAEPVEMAAAVQPAEELVAQPVEEVAAQPVEMADPATSDLPAVDPVGQPRRVPEVPTSVPPEPEPPVAEPAPLPDPQPVEDPIQVAAIEPEPVIERLQAVVEPEPVQVARAVPATPLPPRRPARPTERPADTPAPAQPAGQGGVSGSTAEADLGSGEASSGGGAVGASADYSALLLAWLERHKTYPRRAQIQQRQGVVLVRFVIDGDGALISSAILESSGHTILDREGLETIERAAPMPKPPAELAGGPLEWDVPMRFYLQ